MLSLTRRFDSVASDVVTRFGLLLISFALLAACSEPDPTAPEGTTSLTPNPEARPNEVLARSLALALQDDDLRQKLSRVLAESPVKEEKLHLATFLSANQGQGLLQQMAGNSGLARAKILKMAKAEGAFEIYLPVDEHRESWNGEPNLLVATALSDQRAPVGYDLAGQQIPLSLEEIPTQPVLSLVPTESFRPDGTPLSSAVQGVEVSFTHECTPTSRTCSGHGGGENIEWSQMPDGVYLIDTYIDDMGEGWPNGDPELTVYTTVHDEGTNTGQHIRCTGESAAADEYYNQDNNLWSGEARIATLDQVLNAPPSEEGLQYVIVENDNTHCEIRFEYTKLDIFDAIDLVNTTSSGLDAWDRRNGLLDPVPILIDIFGDLFSESDDLVGFIIEEGCTDSGGRTYKNTIIDFKPGTGIFDNGCARLYLDDE